MINHVDNNILQIFNQESLEMNSIRFDDEDINKTVENQDLKQITILANGMVKR